MDKISFPEIEIASRGEYSFLLKVQGPVVQN